MVTRRIQIKQHLADYINGKFGKRGSDYVQLPDETDLYHIIYDLLERPPAACGKDEGNLNLFIPARTLGKKTESFNYLSERSAKIIERKIETMFWAELHDLLDFQKHRIGLEYSETVYHFMLKYSITGITEDALLKNFYRWRDNIRKKKFRRSYRSKSRIDCS